MRKQTKRDAFTLLEVMIAVMVLSVVIMALLQMYANGAHLFKSVGAKAQANQYISLLAANGKYSMQDDTFSLDLLVEDFEIEDDLRRELKNVKVKLFFSENNSASIDSIADFQITKGVLEISDSSGNVAKTSFLRLVK